MVERPQSSPVTLTLSLFCSLLCDVSRVALTNTLAQSDRQLSCLSSQLSHGQVIINTLSHHITSCTST